MDEPKSVIEVLYRLPLALIIPFGFTIVLTLLLLTLRLRAFFLRRPMNRHHDLVMLSVAPVASVLLGLINIAAHLFGRGLDAEFAAANALDEAGAMLIVACSLFLLAALTILLPERQT